MRVRSFAVGVMLLSSQCFALSASFTMTVASGSVQYYLSSFSPSASDNDTVGVSGSIPVTITYDPPFFPSMCPYPKTISFGSVSMVSDDVSLALIWGSPNGNYYYDLEGGAATISGSPFNVTAGSINFSGGALVVNDGTLVESGTGTLGSQLGRTTDFSSATRSHSAINGSISGGRVQPSNNCQYTLTLGSMFSDTLRSTPTDPTNISVNVEVALTATALTGL